MTAASGVTWLPNLLSGVYGRQAYAGRSLETAHKRLEERRKRCLRDLIG
jgi:hypothetical protein